LKHFFQTLLFFLTCFASSTTFSAPNIFVPTCSNILQKTEKVIHLESSKIGVEHFARSSIEEHHLQTTPFHPTTFQLSSFLKGENSCVLNFPKITFQNLLSFARFSQKEPLSLLENCEWQMWQWSWRDENKRVF
jgi:hypothetical protein